MFVQKHRLPYRKERYINAPGVKHNVVVIPVRATRFRHRPRAWVWVRHAWPGSAAQGKPRRRQAGQAVALRRPGKTRKVSPGFEKYCTYRNTSLALQNNILPGFTNVYLVLEDLWVYRMCSRPRDA